MQRSLTKGPITKGILLFALPLMFGNLLQQMYNIADTWVVGRFLGADALAAVGSSYTLMTFLTSILMGLCLGSGAAVSPWPQAVRPSCAAAARARTSTLGMGSMSSTFFRF